MSFRRVADHSLMKALNLTALKTRTSTFHWRPTSL